MSRVDPLGDQTEGASSASPPPGAGREFAELFEAVYTRLRGAAQVQMGGERAGHTLGATALVHEAFVRLSGAGVKWSSDGAFYRAAAEAMRRVLIEHARSRARNKRGGGAVRVSLDAIGDVADLEGAGGDGAESVFAFDDAFRRLEEHEPAVAEVVRLRFYAGLSIPETARALGVSERTVNNRWGYGRAWLAREMSGGGDQGTKGSRDQGK